MSRLSDQLLNKFHKNFRELWPFAKLGILNLSAIYLDNYLRQGLETW